MGILTRYVLGEIVRTFFAALLVFTMIFFIAGLYELVKQTFSLRQLAVVAPYIPVYTLPFLLPVALLVGCALGYGRMAADNEILPVASGGIPTSTLAAPAILLGIFLSGLLYGLEGSLVPYGWMMKKDFIRGYLEQLTNLGECEDKTISNEEDFHFFCRRASGASVTGVAVVYVPKRRAAGARPLAFSAPGASLESGRPTEIVARRGEIVKDEVRDAVVLRLEDVEFTQWEAGDAPAIDPRPKGRQDEDDLPPRGRPHHGRLASATIDIPFEYRLKDKTEFRSSTYLDGYLRGLALFGAYARDERAKGEARAAAVARLAAALAAPGGGPGGAALAAAELALASPGPEAVADAIELEREGRGYIHGRVSLALAPLLFALIGAAIPLRLRHNNRLLPFLLSFAVVSVTFFLPWLSARGLVDERHGANGLVYYIAPALTLAVGVALYLDLRRR